MSAMEKAGGGEVGVVVTETGWPSLGNQNLTSPKIAGLYNRNLLDHIKANETIKRPTATIDGYFFALFNENQKPRLFIDQNWGLFDHMSTIILRLAIRRAQGSFGQYCETA